MTQKEQEEQREKVILGITEMLRQVSFTFEYKVKKKPAGIKVICEVTQEQMEQLLCGNRKRKED